MQSFLYLHATDVEACRTFYTSLVGLDEIFFSEETGTVGYLNGTVQMTIAASDGAPAPDGWADQLGWSGGTLTAPSWGFELDGERFSAAVGAILDAGTPVWQSEPAWVGYWSFPAKDPQGNTVELSTPNRESWPHTG